MIKIFSAVMEVMLIIASLVVVFFIFKYPKQIFITLPKAIITSIIKSFQSEMTFDLIDIFRGKKNRSTKRRSTKL